MTMSQRSLSRLEKVKLQVGGATYRRRDLLRAVLLGATALALLVYSRTTQYVVTSKLRRPLRGAVGRSTQRNGTVSSAFGSGLTFTPLSDAACRVVAETYSSGCPTNGHMPTSVHPITGELTCAFHISKDIEYLPDVWIQDCVSRFPPVEWAEDAAAFQAEVRRLQFPDDCSKPKSSVFLEPDWSMGKDKNGEDMKRRGSGRRKNASKPKWELVGWLNHGWAYNLFVFSFNVGNHWAAGVPVVTSNSKYRFSDMRCGRGYSCELSELSSCKIESIPRDQVLVYGIGVGSETVMTVDQICRPHGTYVEEYGRCLCDDGYLPAADALYFHCKPYSAFDFTIQRKLAHRQMWEADKMKVLSGDHIWFSNNAPGEENPHNTFNKIHFKLPELRKKHGYLWMHMQSLYLLMRDARTRDAHEARREKLGLTQGRCLALHVRHGDSCHDKFQNHRVCLPLQSFVRGARKLVARYGKYDHVFLATDDPDVIRETEQFKDEFNWVYQPIDRTFYETGDSSGVDVRTEFNAPDKINEIASDIWIMAHCHGFVGSFASSVAWVAYEYMAARHGSYVPFVSVDMPYGHKKNVGRFFEDGEHE